MEAPKEINKAIKLSSFSKKDYSLIIKDDKIIFGGKCIELKSVRELKYGIEGIQFDMFFVGTKYLIDLRTDDDQMKLTFKSYFGFSKNYFNQLYSEIIHSIWKETGVRLANEAIEEIIQGNFVKIGSCIVNQEGILVNNALIPWNKLSTQKNYDRLTINSKSNPKICTNLYYLKTYNIDVLMAIIDWLQADGLNEIRNAQSQTNI